MLLLVVVVEVVLSFLLLLPQTWYSLMAMLQSVITRQAGSSRTLVGIG